MDTAVDPHNLDIVGPDAAAPNLVAAAPSVLGFAKPVVAGQTESAPIALIALPSDPPFAYLAVLAWNQTVALAAPVRMRIACHGCKYLIAFAPDYADALPRLWPNENRRMHLAVLLGLGFAFPP